VSKTTSAKKDKADAGFEKQYFERTLPAPRRGYPQGWMSPLDLQVIYNASYMTKGPILEVGPFVGRSTAAICYGLRDRKREGMEPTPFDTLDLGITSAAEWTEKLKEPFDVKRAWGQLAAAVYHPGGTIAVLIRNIKDLNLLPFVTNFIRGDLVTCPLSRDYKMIFCDTTHDDGEIHRHLPHLVEMAGPGCTLVFDDVITDQRQELICSYLDVKNCFRTNVLYPNREDFCKVMVVETN
jgi:predicted O-methyltransferase YrrM